MDIIRESWYTTPKIKRETEAKGLCGLYVLQNELKDRSVAKNAGRLRKRDGGRIQLKRNATLHFSRYGRWRDVTKWALLQWLKQTARVHAGSREGTEAPECAGMSIVFARTAFSRWHGEIPVQ